MPPDEDSNDDDDYDIMLADTLKYRYFLKLKYS